MIPPDLPNDCFALPPGVDWTPVDDALARLRAALRPITGAEDLATGDAAGRFLSAPVIALRANPPHANSAVDGYGFAAPAGAGDVNALPLMDGRAAAGAALGHAVPAGHAVRVLTGAALPEGVDTVVLQEISVIADGRLNFRGPIKPGANTRKAGEDVNRGDILLHAGRRLSPQDLALIASGGVATVSVHRPLRVGVLSTGDEIAAPGAEAAAGQIHDANRPMLLALAADWGFAPVDLGHVPDDRAALRARLDAGAGLADVIVTSGGASAGDEDHVSALLRDAGAMETWRIALKPGRPLALGMWGGKPVFGLPGNPVAAFVCALIFAAPAFRALAGGDWRTPKGFMVPAAFAKTKKPGRREYLRARLTDDGAAAVFGSEGSGRISGLSWSDGLVELAEGARDIRPGDLVTYHPYASFGR
ncbi:MAG: molybdopterin molybdotransferase [Paracoccaceae bacterium]|jgi:molybdopterin molybdotransferase